MGASPWEFKSPPRHHWRTCPRREKTVKSNTSGSSSAVEYFLAKEGVAGSNPVFRSTESGDQGGVAKRLRRGSAKPLYGGSNPPAAFSDQTAFYTNRAAKRAKPHPCLCEESWATKGSDEVVASEARQSRMTVAFHQRSRRPDSVGARDDRGRDSAAGPHDRGRDFVGDLPMTAALGGFAIGPP